MTMKRIRHILLLCSIILTSSCSLDLNPESSWSDRTYYETEEQLWAVLRGGYARLQGALGGGFVVYGDARSDLFMCHNTSKVDMDNIVNNAITAYNSYANWTPFYLTIHQANLALMHAPRLLESGVISEDSANQIMGEAYAMRAFTYFWIVRIWGAAPLMLKPSVGAEYDPTMKRSDESLVREQIHSDLDMAKELLTDTGKREYFTLTAAWAIEAQLCAWEKNWDGVMEANTHILKRRGSQLMNTSYSLAELYVPEYEATYEMDSDFYRHIAVCDYVKIFNEGNSSESIFELSYSIDDNSTSNALYGLVGQSESLRPTPYKPFFNAVKEKDWRFYVNFYGNSPRWTKYFINYDGLTQARNVVLLRLADFILLEAEALVHMMENGGGSLGKQECLNTAVALVNMIRERAGGSGNTVNAADYDITDPESLYALIANERIYELFGEGYRYFDLVRTDKLISTMATINGQTDIESAVWPIYYTEIIYSKGSIEQNPYYK